MKISKKAAVSMLIAMGYSTVSKWDLERLTERLNNLSEMVDEDTEVGGTAADKKLYEQVLKANKADTKITLTDDGDEAPIKVNLRKPKAPKQEVEIEEEEEEADGEDEEAEEEEEEEDEGPPVKPAKKAAKAPPAKAKGKVTKAPPAKAAKGKTPPAKGKAPAPKAKAKDDDGEKKPKVIASIIEMLQAASKSKPITKAEILAKLAKIFPDKVVEPGHGMHITVTVQVPKRLREDRQLDVRGDTKTGFWLPK